MQIDKFGRFRYVESGLCITYLKFKKKYFASLCDIDDLSDVIYANY